MQFIGDRMPMLQPTRQGEQINVYNINQRCNNSFDFSKISEIYKKRERSCINQYKVLSGEGLRHDLIDNVLTFSKKNLVVALDDNYYFYDLNKDALLQEVTHGVRITVLK